MKRIIFIIISFCSSYLLHAQKLNLAPSKPFTDKYFGTKIIDSYRNLENLQDSETLNWVKSQTDYANSILSKIPKRKFYLEKRLEFEKRQGFSVSELKITDNDKYFYLKNDAGTKTSKLYYRDGFLGKEELLYDPANFISASQNVDGKRDFVITYLNPSWDGNRLALSLSQNGKEVSETIVMEVKTKYIHPEIITNTQPANTDGIKWLDDNSGFFYVYFPIKDSNSKDFYKNTRTVLYKIGANPEQLIEIFSSNNNPDLKIAEDKWPIILTSNQNDQYYIGMLVDLEHYRQTFIIKKEDLLNGRKNWKKLYNKDDKVRSLQISDNDAFFLSKFNSNNYKLCKTTINSPNFKFPQVLIPEKKDEVINSFVITKDGIYYNTTKNGVEAKLYLYKNGKDIPIKLPYVSGNLNLQAKGRDFSDVWVSCSGWTNSEQRFKYDLRTSTFSKEDLAPSIEYPEFKDIIVEEITIKARDGEEIPLSLIYSKNIQRNGASPTLIDSYGSYGKSQTPFFARFYLLWASEGGIMAVAHVRGGGEKGEKWRLGAYKKTKPNSWRDLIDCTEFLIKNKYTSRNKVAIWGASAGGITAGRAMTEKPDLFKAVILEVPMVNTLRDEITPNGQPKEFGTVKDPEEFRALLEMDAYCHIKKNVKYPSTLITGGINDQRVAVWEPIKFAAKLIADDASKNPILLKVDFEGGHGGNVPLIQTHTNLSDIFAFAFWQLGHPEYQPNQ